MTNDEHSRRDWLKAAGAAGLAAVGSLRCPCLIKADDDAGSAVIDIGSRRELFVDGRLIDRLNGMRLNLSPPRPAGIALKYDQPWEGEFSFVPTIIKDGGKYHMYYRAFPPWKKNEPLVESTCYAVSDDGIHWTKPNLGLIELLGSKKNNAIFKGSGFRPFLDARPGIPVDERFKALMPPPRLNTELGVSAYASSDGVDWRRLRKKAVYSGDVTGSLFWNPTERRYVQYARDKGKRIRTIARATSPDFFTWSEFVKVEFTSAQPTVEEQFYANATQPYFRAPHIVIGLAARFMANRRVLSGEQLKAIHRHELGGGGKGIADTVLMTSRADSGRFDRTFLEAFVRPSPGDHNWVSRTNYPGTGIVPTGSGEMSIYVNRHYGQPTNHVERLTMRTDGFASIRAPYRGGEMVTKPLIFEGNRLAINYGTSAAGNLQVEIQDESGNALPGFSLEECPQIIGDRIEQTVNWKTGKNVRALAGKPVRLRFVMRDADLYSLRFSEENV